MTYLPNVWYDSLNSGTDKNVNGWCLKDSWPQLAHVIWESERNSMNNESTSSASCAEKLVKYSVDWVGLACNLQKLERRMGT